MQEKKHYIEEYLDKMLPANNEIPLINEAMRYSLFAGGKRLRPILAVLACELFGGRLEEVMPFACSIEMIHTYSLIHDDLPAMDNDDYRRGKLTNHKVYGDGFAVLAGDALLNSAFEAIIDYAASNPEQRFLQVAQVIAGAAGTKGMIGGQCIDLHFENKAIDYDTLVEMHNKKTGALIAASLMAGAIVAGAGQQDVENMGRYGKLIGLAFQIADDILDVEGSTEKLGKKVGSDKNKHKSTFVTLYGLEKSKQIAGDMVEEAIASVAVYGERSRYLKELARYIIERET